MPKYKKNNFIFNFIQVFFHLLLILENFPRINLFQFSLIIIPLSPKLNITCIKIVLAILWVFLIVNYFYLDSTYLISLIIYFDELEMYLKIKYYFIQKKTIKIFRN